MKTSAYMDLGLPPPSSELEAGFQPTLAFISPLLLVPITAGGRHSLSQLYNQ